MKTETEIAKRLVSLLEMVKLRPQLYMGSEDPVSAEILITGLLLGFRLCDHSSILPRRDNIRDRITQQRGWDTSRNLAEQMKESKMTDLAALHEIIDIEILSIKERTGI